MIKGQPKIFWKTNNYTNETIGCIGRWRAFKICQYEDKFVLTSGLPGLSKEIEHDTIQECRVHAENSLIFWMNKLYSSKKENRSFNNGRNHESNTFGISKNADEGR